MCSLKESFFILLCFSQLNIYVFGQSIYYPLNEEIGFRIEKSLLDDIFFHSSIKPFDNYSAKKFDSITNLLKIENLNVFADKLLNKNMIEKSLNWGSINLNPIISILPKYNINDQNILNNYLFGVSISGTLGKVFEFHLNGYSGIKSYQKEDEIMIDSTGSLPYLGKYLSKNGNSYQFAKFTGYIGYSPFKYLNLKLGVDRHFWGDGCRSLFLSDNSAAFPYLQTCIEVWRLKYNWLLGALSDKNHDFDDNKFRPKFLVAHYLSLNATKWLNFSIFEALISNPTDSVGIFHFNPAYLNPVIFLRPVEFASGSTDNVLMGFGTKIKIFQKYQFYGHFMIDEFIISEIKSNANWWGNKFGFQAGLKVFDLFGIKNLFSRIEYNQVRPYTYSYYNSFGNFGNQFQSLAHPMGANFKELVFQTHFHYKRFAVLANLITGEAGTDSDSRSYGQDIYKPNKSRIADYGILQGQGLDGKYLDISLRFSWIINPRGGLSAFASTTSSKFTNFVNKSGGTIISFGISSLILNKEILD